MPKKKTLGEVLASFAAIWNGRYNYEKINDDNYVDMNTKVPIECRKHGVFYMKPQNHILRKQGCPRCKAESASEMRNGVPRLKMRKKVCGVGVNDIGTCLYHGKKAIPSYQAWRGMLTRCYDEQYQRRFPTYKKCKVCNKWLYFSVFKEWFDQNYVDGYALDKDILVKGNKIYSPNTCCFVPREINALLIKHDSARGKQLIGVTKRNGKYIARINKFSKPYQIGRFEKEDDAFAAYKMEKEKHLKEIAQKYFDGGRISKRVFEALSKYKVETTD